MLAPLIIRPRNNSGMEDNITRDINYSVNGNFSVNTNKVISIGNSFDFSIDNIVANQTVNRTTSGY